MDSEQAKKDTKDNSAILELIGRSFVAGAAVCYVTGFAIQTLHLSRYGISDSSPLKAEYILTGCATLVPLLLPGIVMLCIINLLGLWRTKKPEEEFLRILRSSAFALVVAPLFIVVAAFIVYGMLLLPRGSLSDGLSLGVSIFYVYFAGAMVLICLAVQTGEIKYRKTTYKAPRLLGVGLTVSCSVLPIIMLLSFANTYVEIVHPRIPSGFGGARPIPVQLLFDPGSKPHFIDEESTGSSATYLLHAQTESCYLVTPEKTKEGHISFLQIRKDQLLGLRVLQLHN